VTENQPLTSKRPCEAWTNYDNYVGVGTWMKIGLNNTDTNDQGAFDAANNHFVALADGTYLFGATLLYKINASATARMRGRLVLNGATEIRGSLGEISATHASLATAIWLQTTVPPVEREACARWWTASGWCGAPPCRPPSA
jgi:hypothetical protein